MVNEHARAMRLSRAELRELAQDWVAAWNARDLDRILAGFAPGACFRSPHAKAITGSNLVVGLEAMRVYWEMALARIGELHFGLVDIVCDEESQSLTVYYQARLDERCLRACEVFHFENRLKISGEAFYGA